jgi:hypothetical protein
VVAAPPPPTPSTPPPDAAIEADEREPGRTGDPRAFGALVFKRTQLKDGGDTHDSYVGKAVRAAIRTCFDNIPHDVRSPNHVYKVVLEWPNSGYQGAASSGYGGFNRSDAIGGGGGDYPPSINHAEFRACVNAAVPAESVSSLDSDRAKIRAIRFTVLAYTEGAVGRYLTGSIGHGQGHP